MKTFIRAFPWPRHARAAVSLTYDDAVGSQRTVAAEQLSRRGLRSTFFISFNSTDLAAHRADWQSLAARGHELASHTVHHPCDCSHDWVPKGYTLQDYDLGRMQRELDQTLDGLGELGAKPPYTFAYPCGETTVGSDRESYLPLISQRFVAARGVEPRIADPWREPLELVPAYDGARGTRGLIEELERAEAQGGWMVILFHGIGGDHLAVDASAHDELLAYLEEHRDSLWTERFGTVAEYVRAARLSEPRPSDR